MGAVHSDVRGSLDPRARHEQIERLAAGEPVDLVVVGGGVTGAGVAVDAAARGLRVVLLERHDLAWGTSRFSSKLVHGGLRYLADGAVGLALASARERHVLLTRTAPHLVRPLPGVIPFGAGTGRAHAAKLRAGLAAGDALRALAGTPAALLPRSRRIRRAELAHLAPGLSTAGVRGALLGWDGQLEDDARLVVALARTAAALGATVLTGMAVQAADPDRVRAIDVETGAALALAPRAVVRATGVWADELPDGVGLRPSRGSHLVLAPAAVGGVLRTQLSLPLEVEHERFLLLMPRPDGTVLLGLTDEEAPGPVPETPRPTEAEITFLLESASAALRRPLSHEDVLGAFAGLRPLVDAGAGETAGLSRDHVVHVGSRGAVTITGGKLTTYRQMAEEAVDRAIAEAGLAATPCPTARLPLVGAGPRADLDRLSAPRRLIERHGLEAPRVAALCGEDPELDRPAAPGSDVRRGELVWAALHEGARTVDDLLDRRCRLGLVPGLRAAARPAAEQALERARERRTSVATAR